MPSLTSLARKARVLIRQLKSAQNLGIECPDCGRIIPTPRADLFTEETLSPRAEAYKAERETELAELREAVDDLRHTKEERVARVTHATNVGQTIEKFAPVLRGFEYDARDCRGLFQPIDYLVFHGAHEGRISHLEFVDVKSGRARLSPVQKGIRSLVAAGKLVFQLLETGP